MTFLGKQPSAEASGTGAPRERTVWITAFALLAVAFLILLFYRGLFDRDEGRYAEIPREMLAGGHVAEMRLMGFPYYEKAPLSYWITAASLKVFGYRDWAARVPLLPVSLLLGWLGFFLAARHWPRTRALASGRVAITSAGLLAGMAILLTDNFLCLWMALTCVLAFEGLQLAATTRRRYLCLGAAAVAVFLGLFTKGLVALAVPALVVLLWLAMEKRLSALWNGSVLFAAILCVALIIPMAVFIERHNPGFLRFFFVDEHLSRLTGRRRIQGHSEPFWFYAVVLPPLLLPWFLFVFRAARTLWRRKALRQDGLSLYLLIWAGVVVLLFSAAAGKLIPYILPALLPAGLLIGRWGVAEPLDGTRTDRRLWRLGAAGVPLFAAVILAALMLALSGWVPAMPRPNPVCAVALLPVAAALLLWFVRSECRGAAWLTLTAAAAYFAAAVTLSPLAGDAFLSRIDCSAGLLQAMAARLSPEDQIVMYRHYDPAVAFYANRVPWAYQDLDELQYGQAMEPEQPAYLRDLADLARAVRAHPGRWIALLRIVDAKTLVDSGIPMRADGLRLADDRLMAVELDRKIGMVNSETGGTEP